MSRSIVDEGETRVDYLLIDNQAELSNCFSINQHIKYKLGCINKFEIKIKSKNSETKESGFLAGNPEAYKKFNLKLKKHFKNEASRKRIHLST